MTSHRFRTIALAATFTVISSSAIAASFDGHWSLIARTTNGHCGITRWDVAISGGRFFYPGGFMMGYPVSLAGAVSSAGRVRVNVMAGPRFASGAGRLGGVRGNGRWAGRGPSGICSGVWTAARLQPLTAYAPGGGANFAAPMPSVWRTPYR